MNTQIDLKQTEKASYKLAAFGDGMADLTLGLSILLMGFFPLTRKAFGPVLNAAFFLAAIYGIVYLTTRARRWLGPSRIGIVSFGSRVKKRARIMSLFTAALVALMILVWFLSARGWFPGSSTHWSALLGAYGVEFVVSFLVLVILVGGMAYTLGVRRYTFYGILLAACFPLQVALPIYEGTSFLAAGGIITTAGAVILTRFFKQYPSQDKRVES